MLLNRLPETYLGTALSNISPSVHSGGIFDEVDVLVEFVLDYLLNFGDLFHESSSLKIRIAMNYINAVLSSKVKTRLQELAPAARGSQDAGSRNLVLTF